MPASHPRCDQVMPFQLNTMLDSAMAGWAASHGGCTARSKLVEQAAIHFAEEGDRRGVMLALRHLFFDAAEARRGGVDRGRLSVDEALRHRFFTGLPF